MWLPIACALAAGSGCTTGGEAAGRHAQALSATHCAATPNLVANPSAESLAPSGTPEAWLRGGYGDNVRELTVVAGYDGATALRTRISAHTDGDAKWYFAHTPVTPGEEYEFSDWFRSDVASNVIVEVLSAGGARSYINLTTLPAAAAWQQAYATFRAPTDAATVTVFHRIQAVGELTVDLYALRRRAAPQVDASNLAPNGSIEIAASASPTLPQSWRRGGYGDNMRVLTYPVPGRHCGKAVKTEITSYVSGDAKWYFERVPASAGVYEFSDSFLASVESNVVVEFEMGDAAHTLSYLDLGSEAAGPGWQEVFRSFTAPSGVVALTVFHRIRGVGSLVVDDYVLRRVCASSAECNDDNPYTTDLCPSNTLRCSFTPVADGNACGSCQPGGVCQGGRCHGGTTALCAGTRCTHSAECDDGNPCTTDVCLAGTGRCSITTLADGTTCGPALSNGAARCGCGACRLACDGGYVNRGGVCTPVTSGPAPLLGFANVGGMYRFEPAKNLLTEGADRSAALGLRTQFIYLTGDGGDYPDSTPPSQPWPGAIGEPRARAEHPLYDAYLRRPELNLVTMTVYASGTDWFQRDRTAQEFQAMLASERRQFRELTAYLRTALAGSGKTFILKNWEGDWHLLEQGVGPATRRCANVHLANNVPHPEGDADAACALQMVQWLRARQQGVEDGRAETPSSDVRVYHAVEVNRVQDALAGRLRLVHLLPYVGADMVAYSSYDSQQVCAGAADARAAYDDAIGLIFDRARQLERTQRPDVAAAFANLATFASDPMGLGSARLILSELGSPENERPRADVEGRLDAALDAAAAHGLRAAYVWQLYDNECTVAVASPLPETRVLDTCRGFSLYRPDGNPSWTLEALLTRGAVLAAPVVDARVSVTYGADFVAQTAPTTMMAGATYAASVTMRNTGSVAWRSVDNYRLGSHNPTDNLTWGVGRVRLAPGERVEPGATATFSFAVTAPATPGAHHFQWRMLREGIDWFGAPSEDVTVTVTAP